MNELVSTLLIAVVPSAIAALITYLTTKRKYQAEAESAEEHNAQTILETYKLALDDLNLRLEKYIYENRKREENFLEREMDYMEKIKQADQRIDKLERKIKFLIQQTCVKRGCGERTRIEHENSDNYTH